MEFLSNSVFFVLSDINQISVVIVLCFDSENIVVDIIVKCYLILGNYFINIDGFFDLISEIDNEARKEIPVHLFVNIFLCRVMNNRFRSFKACIQNSQDHLRYRTTEAQKALVKSEDERFNEEMATVWYDVNICM